MNDPDPEQELFERGLRRLNPAKMPRDLAQRLASLITEVKTPPAVPAPRVSALRPLLLWIRRLAPATSAAAALVFLVLWIRSPGRVDSARQASERLSTAPVLRADAVEIDRKLIKDFEAIATMPGGEPVRVRCREWMDEVVLRDHRQGVAIQQRTPRFEIVPVSFETF